MSLRKNLEDKLQLLEIRLLKARYGVSYTQELVNKLITKGYKNSIIPIPFKLVL